MSEFSKLVEEMVQLGRRNNMRSFQLTPKCTKCGQIKNRTEFSYKSSSRRLRSWCKACNVKKSQEYYLTHKRKRKSNTERIVKEFDTRLSVAISKEDSALVKKRAIKKGVSASELVRTYIEWGMENDE